MILEHGDYIVVVKHHVDYNMEGQAINKRNLFAECVFKVLNQCELMLAVECVWSENSKLIGTYISLNEEYDIDKIIPVTPQYVKSLLNNYSKQSSSQQSEGVKNNVCFDYDKLKNDTKHGLT